MNTAKVAQSLRVSNRVGNSLFGFSCESLVFDKKERIALSIFLKESKLLLSLFLKEREEQIALHCYLKEREEQIALHCYLEEHRNVVHSNCYDTMKRSKAHFLFTKRATGANTRERANSKMVPKIRKTWKNSFLCIFYVQDFWTCDLSSPNINFYGRQVGLVSVK